MEEASVVLLELRMQVIDADQPENQGVHFVLSPLHLRAQSDVGMGANITKNQ